MLKQRKLPDDLIRGLTGSKILGIRSGSEHRYTGVWPIVVEGRLFVRTWYDKPAGWYRAFLDEPDGFIQIDGIDIPVRARVVRSKRLRDAVTEAYRGKYNTKGSLKWVEGFAEETRALKTMELCAR